MKRFISFILAFVMIMGSVASAAIGDIIHTETKEVYEPNSEKLINAIINGADIKKFYKTIDVDGVTKFVNIVEQENIELEAYRKIVREQGFDDPMDLASYLETNQGVISAIEAAVKTSAKTIDKITNGGSLDDYFGDSKLAKLIPGENYSTPVPGSTDGTSQIINLTLPRGSNSWVYKMGTEDFSDLKSDTLVEDTKEYRSGRNISVEKGQYLFLAAVDGTSKLKAYASIEISDNMIKKKAIKDDSIPVTFTKSTKYSGASLVSIDGELDENTWKIAIPNNFPEVIYSDTKFTNVKDYKAGLELVLASDNELDNNLVGFKKKIIVYSELNGAIHKYRIFEVGQDKVSQLLDANPMDPIGPEKIQKGKFAGNTSIINLELPKGDTGTKWMYAIVEDPNIVPKRDRSYDGSKPYELGEDIEVKSGANLMILAVDKDGKLRAYSIIKILPEMIKDPAAFLLRPTTHYGNITEGTNAGQASIKVESSGELDSVLDPEGDLEWKYVISEESFDIPEANLPLSQIKGPVKALTDTIIVTDGSKNSFDKEPFTKNLLLLATQNNNIKGYGIITLNQNHVKFPEADKLSSLANPSKGDLPGHTKFVSLSTEDLGHRDWYYKIVKDENLKMEYKQIIGSSDGFTKYTVKDNIPAKVGEYIVIVSVDSRRKALSYGITSKLTENEIMTHFADDLYPTSNFIGPSVGDQAGSTKFTKLYGDDSKWFYKVGEKSFDKIEAGFDVGKDLHEESNPTGYKSYTAAADISGVKENDYLLLVRTDDGNKVTGYINILLKSNHIRGGALQLLKSANDPNFKIIPGSMPGTTKLTDLKLNGIDGSPHNGWKWMYKLMDSELTGPELPYLNQKVDGRILYNGQNINVSNSSGSYGWILILATDSSEQTKAYGQMKITKDMVSEHAKGFGENVKLVEGSKLDSVKFENLPELTSGNEYKCLISDSEPKMPATGDKLPSNVFDYTKDDDIKLNIGKYISLYELSDDKIVRFASFEASKVAQPQATLKLEVEGNIVEGKILNGGTKLILTLEGSPTAIWVDNVTEKSIRDKIFTGFKADSETNQWDKVVASMVADGEGAITLSSDKKTLNIPLPETPGYDITKDQIITLTVPREAIKDALNPILATGFVTIKPTVKATISGDLVNSIVRESDIIAGGKTIIIELTDGIWLDDVSNILTEPTPSESNWSNIVRKINDNPRKYINRNSGSKVTITLPKMDPVDIDFATTSEVIPLEIPSSLIVGANDNVVASPKFTLYPNKIQVEGKAIETNKEVILQAPDYKLVDTKKDTWIIQLENGNLIDNINDSHVKIEGLPRALKANVSQSKTDNGKDRIIIKLTGNSTNSLPNIGSTVTVKIKGSAVSEPNAEDSGEIDLKLVQGGSIYELLKNIEIDVLAGKFMNATINPSIHLVHEDIEYSFNSTNGSNGEDWSPIPSGPDSKINFKAGRVFVRQISNPRVFHEILPRLSHPKAPSGISISNMDYSKPGEVKVDLIGFKSDLNYQVSTDGGNTWPGELDISTPIILKEGFDLRVRLKATEKDLASEVSPKLNGLYLGNVGLKVGSGIIDNTNTSIEFARNLENIKEKKWTGANPNETLVDFKEGDIVWIRQKNSEVNYITFPKITANPQPALTDSISYNIFEKELNNIQEEGLEYKISGSTWKDLNKGTTKDVIFAPGPIEVRTKGSSAVLPSKSIRLKNIIPDPIDPPELKGNDSDKTISYLDKDGTWKAIDKSFDYKVGATGGWESADNFKDEASRNKTIVIYVRKGATKDSLPSKEKAISFTQNITFENIIFDIKNKVILGTTKDMEYSINSKNELNGIWQPASNKETTIEPFEGMHIWLRENNKPSTEKVFVTNLARQPLPNLSHVHYNVGTKKLANQSSSNLEYRINNSPWTKLDAKTDIYGVNFVPGKLEFRQISTTDKIESHPKFKYEIKAKLSGPQVEIDDVDNKIISISGYDSDKNKLEYRINNSPWITGEILSTEDFSGDKKLEIRIKATKYDLESNITTVDFYENLNLDQVRLSSHINPHVLNGTTSQMQYQIYLHDGKSPTGWIDCSDGDTLMPSWLKASMAAGGSFERLEIRDKNQIENKVIVDPVSKP